jgi:predicted nucleic acid-binding protein
VRLLDTSVAVDHLRGSQPAVKLLTGVVDDEDTIVASEVVRFELIAGVRDGEIDSLERFFTALSWVAVDENISRTAGLLARRYRKAHSGIDAADYLIAATAIVLDAELLTTNVRHFPMLEGLRPAY